MSGGEETRRPVRRICDTSGRVRLVVRGFASQQLHSIDEIASAIEWLPAFHLEGLREVIYAPRDSLWYPSLGSGRPFSEWAEYVQRERTVFVYKISADALFWHVLYHEIGHHVYFVVMSSSVKKLWATELHPKSPCPTAYAYSSAAEDFAECYALYAQDTGTLNGFPEKLRFMKGQVFRFDGIKAEIS